MMLDNKEIKLFDYFALGSIRHRYSPTGKDIAIKVKDVKDLAPVYLPKHRDKQILEADASQ